MDKSKIKIIVGCLVLVIALSVIGISMVLKGSNEKNVVNTGNVIESGKDTTINETVSKTKETKSDAQTKEAKSDVQTKENAETKSEQVTVKETGAASIEASSKAEEQSQQPTVVEENKTEEKKQEVASQVTEITKVDADPEKVKSDIMSQGYALGDYINNFCGYPPSEYPVKEYINVMKYNVSLYNCLIGDDSKFQNAYEGIFTKEQQMNRMRYAMFNLIPYSIATVNIEYTDIYGTWFSEGLNFVDSIDTISLSSPALEGRESKVFDGHFADLEAVVSGINNNTSNRETYLVYLSSERDDSGNVSRYRVLDVAKQ